MKKAFLFLANGFEEIEAITPLDYLRRVGIEIITVGVEGKTIYSARNIPVVCDILLDEAELSVNDCFLTVLPGGLKNSETLSDNNIVREIVEKTLENGGFVAAICAAPALALGRWGLLDGKKFTCYPGMGQNLKTKPQKDCRVITDGNIITASGAGVAEEFAFALVEAICGKDEMNKLKEQVVAR